MILEFFIRQKPKKEFTKDFLMSADAYLFELSICSDKNAQFLYESLKKVSDEIERIYL